jgi:hypothetical protein
MRGILTETIAKYKKRLPDLQENSMMIQKNHHFFGNFMMLDCGTLFVYFERIIVKTGGKALK